MKTPNRISHSPPIVKYPRACNKAGIMTAAHIDVIITAKLNLQNILFIFFILFFLVILFKISLALRTSVKRFFDRKSIIIAISVCPCLRPIKNQTAFFALIHRYSPFSHMKMRCTSLKCFSSFFASICLRGGSV